MASPARTEMWNYIRTYEGKYNMGLQVKAHPIDLKENTDLRQIAQTIIPGNWKSHGKYIQTHAPNRDDTTPSLTVWADGFKDFGGDAQGDVFEFLATYAGLDFKQAIDYLSAGGVGLTTSPHRPQSAPKAPPEKPISPTNQYEFSADFDHWQTAAAATIDRLPLATDHPAAVQFLLSKGYTLETIAGRAVRYNPAWAETGHDITDERTGETTPAKVAPGIVYTHRDEHGQPIALFTRFLAPKPGTAKTIQTAGGKPKLGIYGNLDTPHAPVIITAGQKDSDFVAQTFPGPVNAITMGSCNVSLPAWVAQKITNLAAPFVMVMFDNDPPSEQKHADRIAAELHAVLPCPVLVIPPPQGYKDFADGVADGYDVGKFWAGIVAPVNAQVVELLCSFKRFKWVYQAHGDTAYLAALLLIRHEAIARGLIGYDTPLSIKQLVTLSETVGHAITEKAARSGIGLALEFKVWSEFDFAEFGYSIIDKYPLSKLGKNENATRYYRPLPTFIGYRNLAAALENEIPTSVDDWGTVEFIEELHRLGIRDTRPVTVVDRVDLDGSIYQTQVNETIDLLNRLVFLSDPTVLLLNPFVWPDGFTLSTYPNQPESSRPNAPKCLRVALLRGLNELNTRRVLTADGETIEGWQVSTATVANCLGITESSVSEYRRAAGIATREQKPRIAILDGVNKRGQLEKLIGQRRGGVTVWIGARPSYLTPQNRASILDAIERTHFDVSVEIQLPSIQYAAPLEEIEGIHQERSERHKTRVERARRERATIGDNLPATPKAGVANTTPQIAPDAPDIAEPGYTKLFVYYHLLKILPNLIEAAKTSILIARVLDGYGLMEAATMPKDESYKDANFDVVEGQSTPSNLPTPPAPIVPKIETAYSLIFEGRVYERGELSGIWYPKAEKIDHAFYARLSAEAHATAKRRGA